MARSRAPAHPFIGGAEVEEFDYFMIRVRRPAAGALERLVSGVAERLGTGEKRSFATGEELLQFVCGHNAPVANVRVGAAPRNPPDAGPSPDGR